MQIEHNSYPWRVAKNRHPNTDGTAWGWIAGAPGQPCWSNEPGSKFTSQDASRLVEAHNVWLERQTPVATRLLKARERMARLAVDMQRAQEAYDAARDKVTSAQLDIDALETEQASAAPIPN